MWRTQSAKPKVWWQCNKGHEWKANIYSRNLGGHGCPVCKGFKASAENCMAVTHPDLAKLFHPTKNVDHSPENLKAGTGIKLWWLCEKVKWSGKTGQRAKMYPTRTTGYTNDQETQFFRQV